MDTPINGHLQLMNKFICTSKTRDKTSYKTFLKADSQLAETVISGHLFVLEVNFSPKLSN